MKESAFLRHTVNGKVVSKQLCTSHRHADNIIAARLAEGLDPFVRNGKPIQAVWEEGFQYR